jgi:hypothetical protein
MKRFLIYICAVLLLGACADKKGANSEQSNNTRSETTAPASPGTPQAGDTVIYLSDSGQRFFEAQVLSVEGGRARLQDKDKTVERELAELYSVPKAGNKITARRGDIVAARFGQTNVWPGAEVVKVEDRVTLKWLSSGKTDEVSPENVLMLSPSVAARVKASFPPPGK